MYLAAHSHLLGSKSTVNWEIFMYNFPIDHFHIQKFVDTSRPFEILRHRKFLVLNFLVMFGITGCLFKLNLLQKCCEVYISRFWGRHSIWNSVVGEETAPCGELISFQLTSYRVNIVQCLMV